MPVDESSARAAVDEARDRAAARVAALEADLAALTAARRGASDDDEHDPEGETLSSRWSLLSGLLEGARDELRQADAAERRIDAGAYGICAACGRPIPDGQLAARPLRERCVACSD